MESLQQLRCLGFPNQDPSDYACRDTADVSPPATQVQVPFPETLLALLILVAHKSRLEKAKPSLHGLFSMTRQLTAQVLTSSSCLCFR